jgi:molybdate transport system substrate-binding protein
MTPTEATPVRTLTVFAAASLNGPFSELGQNFEAVHSGVKVTFNFAGSQTLSAQIMQGAEADVFASANHAEMDKLVADGLVAQGSDVVFVTNSLVVISPPDNSAGLQSLQDLARPGLKMVLADATVPAGKYALQALDKMAADPAFGGDFKTRVLSNVVSHEIDVKVVAAKVSLGEADAGIVYISDSVASPDLKTIAIPENLNVVAAYPIAALVNAPGRDLASAFVAYVLSPEGQAVLMKWGFAPVRP